MAKVWSTHPRLLTPDVRPQASVLSCDDKGVEGKAIFQSSTHAQEAVALIDGKVEFDTGGHILRASLAPDNLTLDDEELRKRSRPERFSGIPTPELVQAYTAAQAGALVPFPSGAYAFPAGAAVVAPRVYAPVKNEKDNPPCNTLFIGNLGESVDENELRAVFGPQPGFQQLKVVRSTKGISAFIEFADMASAAACHHQGPH